MIITSKEIRRFWWSMFWRFFVYSQLAFLFVGFLSGFLRSVFHSLVAQDVLNQQNILSGGIQGGIQAAASGIALTQALKIHLPLLCSNGQKVALEKQLD